MVEVVLHSASGEVSREAERLKDRLLVLTKFGVRLALVSWRHMDVSLRIHVH
jgi:hypothetical protein